ncbi:PREDICTED: RHOMBOID-like protein 12, mitochondrial [Nelumbo nucifera]|uniref:RHOMBOID-like protein 12, mitochondrial n=1 Tax=Nelumbo nucifera TaxID=4432 RepID=A0A1U8A005_NELNU|nr:PREDICTED: RHOMBOID-like protein 12, mitochondrial [Nelumbo nucifera]
MQRLLSSKLISEIPRKLHDTSSFLESHFCKKFITFTEQNPKQLFKSSVTQPHSKSQLGFTFSRSWRSYHSASEKNYWFFANPEFVKQLASNTQLMVRSGAVSKRGFVFLRSQFGRRHFEINPIFNSSRHRWRSWLPTAEGMVLALIVANGAVFTLWRIADPTFMRKNFMISVENFTSGRIHTLITSAFSHNDIGHLGSNMIGLYFFGRTIGQMFGPEFLLKLYLAGAIAGSVFYLVHHAFMSPSPKGGGMWYVDPLRIPGLGASGAVNAIMLLDIFLFPRATIYFNLFIPVPAILLGAVLIGKDMLRILQGDSEVSGSAHLGGAVVAALAWARIKKRWI